MEKASLVSKRIIAAIMLVATIVMALPDAKAQTCNNPKVLNLGIPVDTSTCGAPNNFDQEDACGNTFMSGREYVFSYTPASIIDNCVSITVTGVSAIVNRGLFVFDGCPNVAGTKCIAQAVYTGLNAPNIANSFLGYRNYLSDCCFI